MDTVATRREHRVEHVYPGIIVSESQTKPVESWDVDRAVADLPDGAVAFRFLTMLVADPVDDSQGGTLKVQPREVDRSGYYYPDGEVHTLTDVERLNDLAGGYHVLLSNMRSNNYERVVKTRRGNFMPLRDGDQAVQS